MRKYIFLILLAMTGPVLLAQSREARALLSKERREVKDAKTAAELVTVIDSTVTPMASNPETMGLPEVYFLPGEKALKIYDLLYRNVAVGQKPDYKAMTDMLTRAYGLLSRSLSADSTATDSKGRILRAYGKKILRLLSDYSGFYNNTARGLLNDAKDYDSAYKLLGIYADLLENKDVSVKGTSSNRQTEIGETRYYQGLSAWCASRPELAMAAFDQAINVGYKPENLFTVACQAAAKAKNEDKLFEYARQGWELFGSANPNFLKMVINGYIAKNDYASATKLLDDAIDREPTNQNLYYSRGILEEKQGNLDEAIVAYRITVQLNEDFAKAWFDLGRVLMEKMDKEGYDEAALDEAVSAFENAYRLDPAGSRKALLYLRQIYYDRNEGDKLLRIEGLLNQ